MVDRLLALALVALAAGYALLAYRLEVPFQYEPLGPKPWPYVLAAVLTLCALVVALRPDPPPEWPKGSFNGKAALMLLTLVGYALTFVQLGFMLTTAAACFVFAWLAGARPLPAGVAALLLAVVGYYGATELLQLNLPWGEVFR